MYFRKKSDCTTQGQLSGFFSRDGGQSTFTIPTDAHNYKITGMLIQLKYPQLLRLVSVHAGTITRELFHA